MFPHERSLVEEMQGRPFVLLGVNNDDTLDTVRTSIKKNKLNWRSFYDGPGGPIVRAFGIRAFPTIMLVDHQGVIRFDSIRENLDEEIEKLVKAAEKDGMVGEKIAPEFRTFRDKSGKHRIEAIAESADGSSVVLRKKDGSTVTIKPEDLSKADQKYLGTLDLQPVSGDASADAGDGEPSGDPGDSRTFADQPVRTFRDTTGKFEVEARLVEISGDQVVLEKANGSKVNVPIDKLDPSDRQYIEEQRNR